jgi:hypothetical protein
MLTALVPRFVKFRLHYNGTFPPPPNVRTVFNFSEGGNDAN